MPNEMKCDICFENNSEREVEKFVGIRYFMTPKVKGIGGIYKYTHKDFIVKEITEDGEVLEIRDDNPPIYFSEDIDDKYTTFNLVKINKETFEAINSISSTLKVPINQISYSGLKDKCSISVQKISIKGNHVEQLEKLKLKDIFIRNIVPSSKAVKLGSNRGNFFVITIRNIEKQKNLHRLIEKIFNFIQKHGFLNYYGLQRFGNFRPNSHLIGRYLLEGNFEKAFEEFIFTTYSTESARIRKFRSRLKKERNYEDVIRSFPKGLNYERLLIEYLIQEDYDYEKAFDNLPSYLFRLLISSFQSYVFNRIISLRLKNEISPIKPVKGDVISILDDDNGNPTHASYIYGFSLDKYLKEALRLNRASIVIPLIGYDTDLSDYPLMQKLFNMLMSEDGFNEDIFKSKYMREHDFKGTFRRMTVKPIGLKIIEFREDEIFKGKLKLKIEFSLPRGSYATMLLRELMK